MIETYRWVVIGYGAIANEMAQTLAEHGRMFYGVAGRNQERTAAFAEKYQIQKIYGKIEEVFADDQVDIVYIATPHNTHIQYLREALKAGKHVLCEKAVTLNTEELKEARQLAEKQDIVLAEAMTIYHMPLYKKLQEVVADGKLGKLQMIQVSFGSYKEYNMSNRFFDPALAGGALLDVGIYPLSFVSMVLGNDIQNGIDVYKDENRCGCPEFSDSEISRRKAGFCTQQHGRRDRAVWDCIRYKRISDCGEYQ